MKKDIRIIVLMGVSGCGKTTAGQLLADRLGWSYLESDDYHTQEDIRKMSAGIPLTDQDRWPWLERLNQILLNALKSGHRLVLGCSALKACYRQVLSRNVEGLVFIHLKGEYTLIHKRMQQRAHFMGADMLRSQFEILEETPDLITVDIISSPLEIVDQIQNLLFNKEKTGK